MRASKPTQKKNIVAFYIIQMEEKNEQNTTQELEH
jgi:hypothetical protein